MKVNEQIHGFTVREVRNLPEIGAEMVSMEFDRNKAKLIWLNRKDDNKTFSITFKTVPDDSTGVFHILEHSVLNGSEKYPVKEPFVELLKSSLQTFLNAFTFPDKTMYPVCSRNDRDFLNLIDVYLDAVLHPLSMSDPHAFLQEGHHLELEDENGELIRNGVVLNEMKGAYSDPDTILQYEINRLLFPDTCYGYDSGGHPEHISELTYEKYKSCHEKYYHPSNSRIFLDGDMDIDAVLAKIESVISAYDYLETDSEIPYQKPVSPDSVTAYYPVTEAEGADKKAMLAIGWVYGSFDEQEKLIAAAALAKLLCGSNESPLTKALLDKNLCDDVYFQQLDGIQQLMAILAVHNADCARIDEIDDIVRETLAGEAERGLDRARLHNILTHMEFTDRERDFSGYPTGLAYAMSAMDSWLYGGDIEFKLCIGDLYERLHKKVDEGEFDRLLREIYMDNPHRACVKLLPSVTMAAENSDREKKALAKLKESMTEKELQNVIDTFRSLRERQNTPDSEEALSSLPVLSLSELPDSCRTYPYKEMRVSGARVICCDVPTAGVTHLTLRFDMSDIPQDELSELSFFASLLASLGTEKYDLLSLKSELDATLGRFGVYASLSNRLYDNNTVTPEISVTISLLDSQKEKAPALVDEILHHTDFSSVKQTEDLLKQSLFGLTEGITQAGSSYGVLYLDSFCTKTGAVVNELSGIGKLRRLREMNKSFTEKYPALREKFETWSRKLFSVSRLTVFVTGEPDDKFLESIIGIFGDTPMGKKAEYTVCKAEDSGFVIPSEIGYAATSSYYDGMTQETDGIAAVASQLLTYDYLWNAVRVKGGAYGTGFSMNNGQLHASSYRDPSPQTSLEIFRSCGEAIRSFCDSDTPVDKFIISTVGSFDPLLTPRTVGILVKNMVLSGKTDEDRQKIYSAVLHTDKEKLRAFADLADRLTENAPCCIIGSGKLIPEGFVTETV